MSGYGPMDGLAATAAALVVMLLAMVSLLGTTARRRSVALGEARTGDLCELTGITDPRELQDVFGPPGIDRVWRSVSLAAIDAERRPLGRLISDDRVDWACIGVAVLSFFWRHPLVEGALAAAVGLQIAGWIVAARLPR